MKNLIVVFVFVSITSCIFAQQIEISEAARTKENSIDNSFLFELSDIGKEEAMKDWEKFMGQFKGKTKYNRKTKLYVTKNAKIPRLSDATVTVYTRMLEDKTPTKRTSVIVWFLANDKYINSKESNLKGAYAHELLIEYALITSKHHAQMVQKLEEKRLGDLEKDLNKLQKDNKEYRREIEKAKELIAKNEKNIEVNDLDQINKSKAIQAQKLILAKAKKNVEKYN